MSLCQGCSQPESLPSQECALGKGSVSRGRGAAPQISPLGFPEKLVCFRTTGSPSELPVHHYLFCWCFMELFLSHQLGAHSQQGDQDQSAQAPDHYWSRLGMGDEPPGAVVT